MVYIFILDAERSLAKLLFVVNSLNLETEADFQEWVLCL